jgi:hypothetical protein
MVAEDTQAEVAETVETNDDPFASIAGAPETIKVASSRINDAAADRLYMIASTNANGVGDGKTYASREDPAFVKASKSFRAHLASRLNPETHRAAIVVARPPKGGAGVVFYVQIKARKAPAAE